MTPFLVVKAFSTRSDHHTRRATNDDLSSHCLYDHYHYHHHHHHLAHQSPPPHNHTSTAGISVLMANALFAGSLTLLANTAFTRRLRSRWAQPQPPSPSPLLNPPTTNSTNPSPHYMIGRCPCSPKNKEVPRNTPSLVVTLISSYDMVGFNKTRKAHDTIKVLEDAYKLPPSVVIVDDIESILQFVPMGTHFTNDVLQTFLNLFLTNSIYGRRIHINVTTSRKC